MTTEQESTSDARRRGGRKPYPVLGLEATLVLASAIEQHALEEKIRRLTLFHEMQRSPNSSTSRMLIANSAKYGLTIGNYSSEFLELTDKGRELVNGDITRQRGTLQLAFDTAIGDIELFSSLYEQLRNQRVPSQAVMNDHMGEHGVAEEDREAVASIVIENLRYLGLVTDLSGTDYIIPLEQVLEEVIPTQEPSHANEVAETSESEIVVDKPDESPTVLASRQQSVKTP